MAEFLAQKGRARETAVLATALARIEETGYDNWNGGQHFFTVYLEIPGHLFLQLEDERSAIQDSFIECAKHLTVSYDPDFLTSIVLVPALTDDSDWRSKARAFALGQGVNNQGRIRSDNVAPLICDGLLFRVVAS